MIETTAPLPPRQTQGLSGSLSERPVYAVLRRIQRERLTGTLALAREDQSRLLSFENGELRSARSSNEQHRIGQAFVRWGYLSSEQLESALQVQVEKGGRLDQILVEQGLVSRAVSDDEARRLMEQIVLSAISWSSGSCHFLPGAVSSDQDIAFPLSTTELVIEGIRRVLESEQFLERLGDLSLVPKLGETLAVSADIVRLPAEAGYMLSRIDGKTSLEDLLRLSPGPRVAAAKLLYTLLYCGLAELQKPAGQPPPRRAGRPDESLVVAASPGSHRRLIDSTYRRIDWLSHYDLLGVSRGATAEEIEQAYGSRLRLFDSASASRPDLASCRRQLSVLSARVHTAYETLSHDASREAYDHAVDAANVQPLTPCAVAADGANAVSQRAMARARRDTASQNFGRATELVARRQYFPAIELLREAVRFEPQNADYRRLLGIALLQNLYWREEAIEHLEEAARLEPGWAEVHGRLAEAYLEGGDAEKALTHARSALNVAPEEERDRYRALELRVEEALSAAQGEARGNPVLRFLRNGIGRESSSLRVSTQPASCPRVN